MNKLFQSILNFVSSALSLCPVYRMGNKLAKVKPIEDIDNLSEKDKKRIALMRGNIRSGRMIMLVGLCCPILWISILTGQTGKTLIFNFFHSGTLFLIGAVQMRYYKVKLGEVLSVYKC